MRSEEFQRAQEGERTAYFLLCCLAHGSHTPLAFKSMWQAFHSVGGIQFLLTTVFCSYRKRVIQT